MTLILTAASTIYNIISFFCKKKKIAIGISPPNDVPESINLNRNESLKIFRYSNLSKSPSVRASFSYFEENPANNSIMSVEEIKNE